MSFPLRWLNGRVSFKKQQNFGNLSLDFPPLLETIKNSAKVKAEYLNHRLSQIAQKESKEKHQGPPESHHLKAKQPICHLKQLQSLSIDQEPRKTSISPEKHHEIKHLDEENHAIAQEVFQQRKILERLRQTENSGKSFSQFSFSDPNDKNAAISNKTRFLLRRESLRLRSLEKENETDHIMDQPGTSDKRDHGASSISPKTSHVPSGEINITLETVPRDQSQMKDDPFPVPGSDYIITRNTGGIQEAQKKTRHVSQNMNSTIHQQLTKTIALSVPDPFSRSGSLPNFKKKGVFASSRPFASSIAQIPSIYDQQPAKFSLKDKILSPCFQGIYKSMRQSAEMNIVPASTSLFESFRGEGVTGRSSMKQLETPILGPSTFGSFSKDSSTGKNSSSFFNLTTSRKCFMKKSSTNLVFQLQEIKKKNNGRPMNKSASLNKFQKI